jgi:hypothetical protein
MNARVPREHLIPFSLETHDAKRKEWRKRRQHAHGRCALGRFLVEKLSRSVTKPSGASEAANPTRRRVHIQSSENCKKLQLWAVLADTTYGSAVQRPHDAAATVDCTPARSAKAPGRGKSLCEVQCDEAGELRVHGVLSNGQPFEARQADRALGLPTAGHWLSSRAELSWVSVASRGHLECTSFQEPNQSASPKFSFGEHKTTEQTQVLSGGSSFNDGTTQTVRDPPLKGGRLAPLKSVYFGSNEGRGPVPSVQP